MDITKNMPQGASYEFSSERKKRNSVQYAGNNFEQIVQRDNTAQTLRLLHEGKISTVMSSKLGAEEEMMKDAAEAVKFGSPYDETFAEATEIKELTLADDTDMSAEQMIDMIDGLVKDVQAIDSRVVVGGGLSREITETTLKTSNGFDHSYKKSMWSCWASLSYVQGDDRLGIWADEVSMRPDFDLKKLKEELAQKLEWSKNIVPFEAGAYPVIFTPSEVGFIINPIIASLNGTAIHAKMSPWTEKLGQELLDPRFTLIDDGSIDNSHTSKPFDMEGVPTQRNTLVKNGHIQDILLNKKVATQLGKKSTGNAGLHGITANYLMLEAGLKSLEEMIKSIDYGMIIDNSMGAWSGNPYAGIVSGTITMGLKIEKGKIVGRVKDCMYTVNSFEHFAKHLVDCSVERKQDQVMGVSALLPYVMLNDVVISTK
ncbi:MAG: TldD/PmbA family protein [Defluviitaleaceae bacterium]|nr:TldD/PmbA family protein [Defluviitaleaceae bacterium]